MPEQLIFAVIPDALPYSAADLRRDPDCYSFVLETGSLPQCLLSKLSKTSVSMVSFLKENMLSFVAFSSQLLKGPLDRKEKKVNFYSIESPECWGSGSIQSEVRIRILILPFSHQCVEQIKIMPATLTF
jgi:hypothetical protein